jgi:peptidoglycan/LPS O-acetylase OafA/YrhL
VWRWARKPSTSQLRAALVMSALFYVVGQLYRVYLLVALPSWGRQGILWSPNWADFFAIGMATAVFSAAHARGMRLPSVLRFLGDHPAVSWCIAVLVGASFAFFSPPVTPGVLGAEYWVRRFLFGVFSFFLLAPAMFGDQRKGLGRRILASKPLVLLGTVSLGFYLFQLAVMANVQEWLAPDGTSSAFYGSLPVVFTLTFFGAIALAFLSYYLVERPCLRLKDGPVSSLWRRSTAKTSS